MYRARLHPRIGRTRLATIDSIGHTSLHGLSILILLCSVGISACSDHQSQRQSGTPGSSPPATLSIEEIVRIGDEAAGDTVFFASIGNIAVNSRGQMFIEERWPAAIRAFDSDGSYLADVGAVGNGPGEYPDELSGGVLTGPADSVYVYHSWGRNLLIYGPDKFEFVRNVTLPRYPAEEGFSVENFRILGVEKDGYVVQFGLVPSEMLVTAHRETSDVIQLVNLDGNLGPIITTSPISYEGVVEFTTLAEFEIDQKLLLPADIPFGRSMMRGLGSDGMLFSGWNDSINIAVMSIYGPEEKHISLTHDPIPISDAEMENRQSFYGPEMRAKFSERGLHTTKPAFRRLLVDNNNRVWLKPGATQDSTDVKWIVVDMDSRVVGKVIFPFGTSLRAIRGGRIYAVETKSGVPTVAVYELNA
ncbi:MAG: 6-bladed beta-propeller [Bacteroidota bacterium]|nr:6-bladed beta-propeller [Bacteroidota bacterium]